VQPTGLVHEVYLRLVDRNRMTIHNRTHFLAVAARLMRQILVDHGRRKQAAKRGGAVTMISLAESSPAAPAAPLIDVLALDEALHELTSFDARLCRVIELRYFAGLDIEDTAEALEVSTATVERDWAVAKAWLSQRLSSQP
jgi:RNA polymerase sigma factor (TIGR02999 family)